jgi:hypothetical protein
MKTGRDADCSGLYVSECCQMELQIVKGQMLPRCPQCICLTVWEIQKQEKGGRNELEITRIV